MSYSLGVENEIQFYVPVRQETRRLVTAIVPLNSQ